MSVDYELEIRAQKLVNFIEQSIILLSETLDKAEEQNCSSMILGNLVFRLLYIEKCKRKLIDWTFSPNMSLFLQELYHPTIINEFGLSTKLLLTHHPVMSILSIF